MGETQTPISWSDFQLPPNAPSVAHVTGVKREGFGRHEGSPEVVPEARTRNKGSFMIHVKLLSLEGSFTRQNTHVFLDDVDFAAVSYIRVIPRVLDNTFKCQT
ncbi:hypothetical protein KM043_005800 [Ampulex compressa]|nr:hypothetical protein KM043_005800 [Ampulex compressa]